MKTRDSTTAHNKRVDRDPGRFRDYINSQVLAWINTHDEGDREAAEFEVTFYDEDALGEVSCLVMIHTPAHFWRSWETGDDPADALEKSLDRLCDEPYTY